ncbi:MAG: Rrf2 family transcriptional regulator [Chitinophagaceae bacterium]|nr:Rrf2 family transcriptional regulator [Chitinophagaceae bacterium]MBP6476523.1 Rrf2 family transcriptional regulator [Chitinophagaceae bacterium]MBP7107426.1 Rrf2 family transcriptional regulator [Chitinophagaceae bacterium]MBP7314448.1 Rrf2 family transcriptional regulator [Chitinophagaceae bacterium]HQX95366.1 Rrf2 family transcriptional regulator [Chitinophagaceae bacterium]
MLSLTCKTAIKAVIYLASKFESEEKSGIKEIAEYINASEHTVGKVLQTLVKEGVINSLKGPTGGFFITARQINQPIINIVISIDGKDVFNQCGLGLSKCSATHPCPIHDDYKAVRDLFEKMCRQKNVKDLCDPVNSGVAYLLG